MIVNNKRILIAALFCMVSGTFSMVSANPDASASTAAGAAADNTPLTTTFTTQELAGVNKINLFDAGKLTAPKTFKGVSTPPKTESFVEFKMITDQGLPANFLIRRTNLSPERRKGLRVLTHAHKLFKDQLDQKLGNDEGIITAFYMQHPTISDRWTEMSTITDHDKDHTFGDTFDAEVFPNGLILLRINNKTTLVFGIGGKTANELVTVKDGKGTIQAGGGKTIDAAQLAKSAL
jgi:hypothetical protein